MPPRPMLPNDVGRVVVVEELDVAADGSFAVVVRRIVRRNRYESHLYRVDLTTRRSPERLTSGRVRDSWPRLAPDGSSIAFLRSDPDDDDAPNRLVVMSLGSRRLRTVAPPGRRRGFGGIAEFEWSPDGSRIAFTAEVDPPRFIVGTARPVGAPRSSGATHQPVARRITRADWRWDGTGHRDHWPHLFVVDVAARSTSRSTPRQVTHGDWGVRHPAWHPDGRTIAFSADRGEAPDVRPQPSIWAVDADADVDADVDAGRSLDDDVRLVLVAAGGAVRPAYSPDGRWLAAVGVLEPRPLDDVSPGLLLGPADGDRPATALAPELDRPIGNLADTDLNGWMAEGRPGPVWLDGRTIVAVVTDRGRSRPIRWSIDDTGHLTDAPLASDRTDPAAWADVTTEAIVARCGRIVGLGTLADRAMEVVTFDLAEVRVDHRVRSHTTFGSSWQRRFCRPLMERVEVPGPGGPIETWIASPSEGDSAALPTIVNVHGGPLGCWTPAPPIEVMMLTGAGYRVVMPNIRGSAGYGREWIRPQLGDWGGVDADDVHAALDHVVEAGLADPNRVGVLGLSYGGFMVNWLVGTSDRFAAAVSENGVTNQVSDWANSDSGPEYDRASLLGDPFSAEGVERLWRQSPLRNVTAVTTPLLMLQAESDLRCPPHDNEQFFIALRHLGRTVEYVLYPEESHLFAATGRPDRRIDRMERMLDWFDRHL